MATKSKSVTIKGQPIEPPARRVIIEKLPAQPPKPAIVQVDRWLAPPPKKLKIIVNKPKAENQPEVQDPSNLIVQWSLPMADIKREVLN